MKIVAEEKKIVMGLYFVTLLALLLSLPENVPLRGVLDKVRYLYIALMIIILVYDGLLIWNRRFLFAIGPLLVHTVLYGLVFVNPIIKEHTINNFKELCLCYLTVIVTTLYVYKKKCYLLFLELSFCALALMMLWCAFTHPGDFVNPVYFVNIFSKSERFRAAFGMWDVNYAGNYCLYTLVFGVLLYFEWKKTGKLLDKKMMLAFWGVNGITLCMLLSTASRSAILSLFLFGGVVLLLNWTPILRKHMKKIIIIGGVLFLAVLTIMISTGSLAEIWSQSNREGNVSINLPIFHAHGNYLNGMGYMDNSGYLNKAYGYDTTAMDIYYLHIFFSTGILGAVLVFGQMLYILFCLLRYSKTEGRDQALSLFVMMLFFAVWQVNYMNSRYWTGILHMVVLFLFLLRINEGKDTYLIKIKGR